MIPYFLYPNLAAPPSGGSVNLPALVSVLGLRTDGVGGTITAQINFLRTGVAQTVRTGNAQLITTPGEWHSDAPSADIGTEFEIRFRDPTGHPTLVTPTLNSWLSLGSTRSTSLSVTTVQNLLRAAACVVDIRDAATLETLVTGTLSLTVENAL